jgi:hypothetical protein
MEQVLLALIATLVPIVTLIVRRNAVNPGKHADDA